MDTDSIILSGILISGGLMALLPLLKDPIDRSKNSKWIIGKFNWVAYTLIGLFILGVLLGNWQHNRDVTARTVEKRQDAEKTASQIAEVKRGDSIQLAAARDSIISFERGGFGKMKQTVDSYKKSTQRRLDGNSQSKILKMINQIMQSNKLSADVPIQVGYSMTSAEALKYAYEISDFLKAHNYNSSTVVTMGKEKLGFKMSYLSAGSHILIDVGLLGDSP